jgi:alpha-L-rhamnosidase
MSRRAPFIWTAEQPVDPHGFVAAMSGRPERNDGVNRWFLFRRAFNLPGPIDKAPTRVTVDGRYRLFVNGTPVGRGPVRCDPLHQKYDSYDLAAHLRPGSNVVGLIVHTYGVDTSWYETVKGLWRPTFGDGAVWLDGNVVRSDLDWRCLDCAAWMRDVPRVNHGLGFVEWLDANLLPADWLDPAFDDSGWSRVRELVWGGGGPEAMMSGLEVRPFPILEPSGIPPLVERPVHAARLVWVKAVAPRPELPIEDRIYGEPFVPLHADAADGLERVVLGDGGTAAVRTATGADVSFLLDFGRVHTAYPYFDVVARGGETIEIAAVEQIVGEFEPGGLPDDARIVRREMLGLNAHVARYVCRPGRQRFERFEWQAVKWLQVTVRDAPDGLIVSDLGITQTHYPVEEAGGFACADPMLTELWRIGAYTLKMCMHDGWEDCPSREQRQWLGDATVEQLAGQAAFGPSVNALNAKYLKDAAASQRPDGLTQMFAPGNHGRDGLLIPDWTLQWILNARNHLLWSGDLATIEAIFPAIQRALAWFERLRTANASGLVADLPYWHFMDWAGVGRHGEACALNAQLAGCLAAAADLADALDSRRAAAAYRRSARTIQAALGERHWDERRGVYVDCVDPATGAQEPRVSQHANAAMMLWGGAPPERWARMIERITEPARLTFTAAPPIVPSGEPLDPERGVVLANTFYGHFVQEALVKAGRTDLMLALVRQRYGPMLARGATTLWESFEPTASLCHGFSATPTYQLVTGVCGLTPGADGFGRLRFAPDLADLDHASARLVTVRGPIGVELRRAGDGFDADLDLPEGLEVDVVAPPGHDARRTGAGFRFDRCRPL